MTEFSALDAEIRDLLRFASERSILPRFQALAADEIEMKGDNDPVTIVDREVESFLSEALTKLAPDIAIVGEEAVAQDPGVLDKLSGACWIIDPLDGTANYTEGKHPFGTIIALADAGVAVAGWLYDPQRDRLCHARAGQGDSCVEGGWAWLEQVWLQACGAVRAVRGGRHGCNFFSRTFYYS